jgi:2'-5' RNA ligase
MKRVFVAVDISDAARRKVAAYIEALQTEFRWIRVGWDKPEKLHLTLKFLGDADEKQLTGLEKIAKEIAAEVSNFKCA